MPNKYIRVGATFNGDGTSSALAASNGGVGAWNTLAYFEGTAPAYGSLAAGDVVYIRSKNEAGDDITVTHTATVTLGSAVATVSGYIQWIIDNGEIWPGIDGTITYTNNIANNVACNLSNQYNEYICRTRGSLRIVRVGSVNTAYNLGTYSGGLVDGMMWDWSGLTGSGRTNLTAPTSGYGVMRNIMVKAGYRFDPVFRMNVTNHRLILINPDIELFDTSNSVFGAVNTGTQIEVIGGKVHGSGAPGCQLISGDYPVNITGLKFPKTMLISRNPRGSRILGQDTSVGAVMSDAWGVADTLPVTGNYPFLDARLPDSTSSGWSWKVYPSLVSRQVPMRFQVSSKFYQQAPAVKTLTLEALIERDDFKADCNTQNLWAEFHYFDTDGNPVVVSTRDDVGVSLEASTANWSADYYGAVQFDKIKFSATTPSAIAQDTMVTTVLWGGVQAGSTAEYLLVCPDVRMT
jgi:hypothetical protein